MSDKLKQSIERYWENRKILEYLDLAVEPRSETKSIEGIEFSCYKEGFKHLYHYENRQLNLLCDLQLNTLHNVSVVYDRLVLLSKVCSKHLHSLEENFEKLEKVLSIENIEQKIRKIPTKSEVVELISSITDQPKKSEKEIIQLPIQLEQKIERIEGLLEQLNQKI